MTYKGWTSVEIGRVVPLCNDQRRNIHRRAEEARKYLSAFSLVLLSRPLSEVRSKTRRLHTPCLTEILSRNGGNVRDGALLHLVVVPIVQVGV